MVPTGVMRYRTPSSHHLPSWRSAGSLLLMVTARLIRNSPLTATSYVVTGCSCDLPSSVRLRHATPFYTCSRESFPDGSGVVLPCVAKRRSHGLERICATFHSLWEVLDCVAKRRISGLGRMWQALREVPKRAASGPRLQGAAKQALKSCIYIYIYIYPPTLGTRVQGVLDVGS